MIWNAEVYEGDDDEVRHHSQQGLFTKQVASFIVCI